MIAEEWVINGGTPENFRAADELIARLIENGFEQDDDEPREYASPGSGAMLAGTCSIFGG